MAIPTGTAIDIERLIGACDDQSQEAGIAIRTELQPLAGPNAPIKPATYAGGVFQEDRRWWGAPVEQAPVLVIDNVPSQANRLEAALMNLRSELGLPEIVLDLRSVGELPPHLPKQLSSFQLPHRQADAYLRDALLENEKFERTEVGKALFAATPDNPDALFRWFPQALLFGYWQSHLGPKRTQAKLARSWVSEIAGYWPASVGGEWTKLRGIKGDPLNLSLERVTLDRAEDPTSWKVPADGDKADSAKRKKLSDIGHGQVLYPGPDQPAALAGPSFRAIEQQATVSFASLRRIRCSDSAANAVGRALLVAIGLAAHVAAFSRPFSLRSGCDLRPTRSTWTWLGGGEDEALVALDANLSIELLRACAERTHAVGLTRGGGWGEQPLVLAPNDALRKAIAATWPQAS